MTVRSVAYPGGVRVEFSSPNTSVWPAPITMPDASRIGLMRTQLDKGLTRLRDVLPGLSTPDERLGEVLAELGTTGRRVLAALVGASPEYVRQLRAFWRRAVPGWDNAARPPALVECVGLAEHLLPLEYLPLFDTYGCGAPTDDPERFVRQCRAFVGFSCVVRRRLLVNASIPQDDGLVAGSAGDWTCGSCATTR